MLPAVNQLLRRLHFHTLVSLFQFPSFVLSRSLDPVASVHLQTRQGRVLQRAGKCLFMLGPMNGNVNWNFASTLPFSQHLSELTKTLENTDTLWKNTAAFICACDVTSAFWKAYVLSTAIRLNSVFRCLHSGQRCQVYVFLMNFVIVLGPVHIIAFSKRRVFDDALSPKPLPVQTIVFARVFPVHTWTLENITAVIYTCAHYVNDVSFFESLRFRGS